MTTLNSSASTNGLAGGTGGSNLLPKKVASDIWKQATANSLIPNLSKNTPMILGENTFPVLTKRPAAGIVSEGGLKPGSKIEVGSKTVKPIKAVVGIEFTMEAVMTNPAGVLDNLSEELSQALARQIDLAVMHGRVALDGTAISDVEFLSQTTNVQALDTVPTAANGGMDKLIWDGYGQVVGSKAPFTGFAFDPRLVYNLSTERDTLGNRRHPELSMATQGLSSFEGIPTGISFGVSGEVDESDDTGVRGFGGNWNALKFGYVAQIPLKKIEYGDPLGNGDLQARNCVAYLTEVIFGWAIMDLGHFVQYTVDLTP